MPKIITLIAIATLITLSSCGSASNQLIGNTDQNPSDEAGQMVDDSSTIIVEGNTDSIESGAQ